MNVRVDVTFCMCSWGMCSSFFIFNVLAKFLLETPCAAVLLIVYFLVLPLLPHQYRFLLVSQNFSLRHHRSLPSPTECFSPQSLCSRDNIHCLSVLLHSSLDLVNIKFGGIIGENCGKDFMNAE